MSNNSSMAKKAALPERPSRTKTRPLRRGAGAPLHHQIFLVLRDQILSGRYSSGASLPTEEELAKLFGVSRITVRSALKNLEARGLIHRRQGVGTFVRDHIPEVSVPIAIRDQRAQIEEAIRHTSVKLLDFEYGPAPPEVRHWFQCGTDELFLRVVRVRSAARPVLLLTIYMPEQIGRLFSSADFRRDGHYELLAKSDVRMTSGEQVISASLADPVAATHLKIEIGSPLIRIIQIELGKNSQPIRFLEVLAPPAEFEIHMKIGSASVPT